MINRGACHLALRNRALGTVVATTGTMELQATATGYHREDAGSFLDDGFRRNMEIVPAGFTANTVDVIRTVTAANIVTMGGRATQALGAGRSLTVGLPLIRAWENETTTDDAGNPTTRIGGRPYLVEEMGPMAGNMVTSPMDGGLDEADVLYVLTLYSLAGFGTEGPSAVMHALATRFAIGTHFAIGDDDELICGRLRQNGGTLHPQIGQYVPIAGGWMAQQLQITALARSRNVVLT